MTPSPTPKNPSPISWQAWLAGLKEVLFTAAITAGANLAGGLIFDPSLTHQPGYWKVTLGTIGVAALRAGQNYLRQSPIPPGLPPGLGDSANSANPGPPSKP